GYVAGADPSCAVAACLTYPQPHHALPFEPAGTPPTPRGKTRNTFPLGSSPAAPAGRCGVKTVGSLHRALATVLLTQNRFSNLHQERYGPRPPKPRPNHQTITTLSSRYGMHSSDSTNTNYPCKARVASASSSHPRNSRDRRRRTRTGVYESDDCGSG